MHIEHQNISFPFSKNSIEKLYFDYKMAELDRKTTDKDRHGSILSSALIAIAISTIGFGFGFGFVYFSNKFQSSLRGLKIDGSAVNSFVCWFWSDGFIKFFGSEEEKNKL
jgi:hypothetical protein